MENSSLWKRFWNFVFKNIIVEIVVAVIAGIVVAMIVREGRFAIPATPIPPPSLSPTPNSVPPTASETLSPLTSKLLFSDDFEDGFAHGFNFWTGAWQVVDDSIGNKALEQNMGNNWTNASFGPSNFSDGIIEFRFRVISGENQAQTIVLHFRNQLPSWTGYVVSYDAKYGSLDLNYHENDQSWQPVEEISGGGSIQNSKGSWITLRIEAQGKSIKVFINDNLRITASDSRVKQGEMEIGTSTSIVAQFDDFKVWDLMSK